MPSTSLVIAGTGANNADAGNVAWTNPGSVTAADGNSASSAVKSGTTTQYLHATNFGFSIPANAIIEGVAARILKMVGALGTVQGADHTVQLIVGGARSGNNNAQGSNWARGTLTNADYGGPGNMWGLALTPANINASNFGLAVRAQNTSGTPTFSVDAIWLQIYYSEPSGVMKQMHSYRQRRI